MDPVSHSSFYKPLLNDQEDQEDSLSIDHFIQIVRTDPKFVYPEGFLKDFDMMASKKLPLGSYYIRQSNEWDIPDIFTYEGNDHDFSDIFIVVAKIDVRADPQSGKGL